MIDLYPIARKLLFSMSPETAHHIASFFISRGFVPTCRNIDDTRLNLSVCGMGLDSPIGLAAGFDKDATMFDAMFSHGFGFTEIGTVTPRAQQGNAKPRMYRLAEDKAIINRLGFNNNGAEAALRKLVAGEHARIGMVGVNIGKNRDTDNEHALDDYIPLIQMSYELADYITINISSPNTKGLRELQRDKYIHDFIKAIMLERNGIAAFKGFKRPIMLKISPDMEKSDLRALLDAVMEYRVDSVIVSNTTLDRPKTLHARVANEEGGLSGAPLTSKALHATADIYRYTKGSVPIIGAGGIMSGDDAVARIRHGASLIQLYTGLIYKGFALVQECKQALVDELEREGLSHIEQLTGIDAA